MLPNSTPSKTVQCQAGCGRTIEYRTSKPKRCDECNAAALKERDRIAAAARRRKKGIPLSRGVEATCAGCGLTYEKNGGRTTRCAPCQTEKNRAKARAVSLKKCRDRGAPRIGDPVPCTHCGTEFPMSRPTARYCEACKLIQQANQLPAQKAAMERGAKKWRELNKTDPIRAQKEKDRLKKSREKRKANPAFTINERMSAALRQNLEGGKNGWRWERLVGYTLAELMVHLERQFLPNMSWANRGEWHIDHVVALSSFRFEDVDDPEFKRAWSLPNLRPLWAKDNLKKLNRRTHLL